MTTGTITASVARIDIIAEAQRIAATIVDAHQAWERRDDATLDALTEALWSARATLASTPARTIAELRAKAGVFMVEAKRDVYFECDPEGSARDLAMALARDVLALADG